jgi:3-hydroxyisobutyrate dehydrogenase
MGRPICRRLIAAGFTVSAFDIDAGALSAATEVGAAPATDAQSLAAQSDICISVLPGVTELRAVFAGDPSPLHGMRQGSLWLDLTSGDPILTDELASAAAALGVRAATATMGGGPVNAEDGTLTFYVAGAADAVADACALLGVLAPAEGIRVVGETPSNAQTVKLLANLLWFGQAVAVSEALLLGERLGMAPAALGDALVGSAGGSYFLQHHRAPLVAGDYSADFGFERCVEELQTIRGLAASTSTPFELGDLVTRLHERALEHFGPRDSETLVAAYLHERAAPPVIG